MEVTLSGQTVRVKTDADEQYVKGLAAYVDKKIAEISRRTRTVSTQRVALLVAMDIADEYFRSRSRARDFRREVKRRSGRLLEMLDDQAAQPAGEQGGR
jgi:cell division protein ZapA